MLLHDEYQRDERDDRQHDAKYRIGGLDKDVVYGVVDDCYRECGDDTGMRDTVLLAYDRHGESNSERADSVHHAGAEGPGQNKVHRNETGGTCQNTDIFHGGETNADGDCKFQ